MALVAVYDACVLFPNFLRDFLVRLADHGRKQNDFRAKWTGRIHQEWIRAVLRHRPDLERSSLLRTRRFMDQHVPGCRIRGYQRWVSRLTLPDADDRHVLAAALACVADSIVTFNLKDFPKKALRPFGMTAVTPDTIALHLFDTGIVVAAAAEQRANLRRPAMSPSEYLDALRRNNLPNTADALVGKPI